MVPRQRRSRLAAGAGSSVSGTNAAGLGPYTSASYQNSTSVGYGAATTKSNQVFIGSGMVELETFSARIQTQLIVTNIQANGGWWTNATMTNVVAAGMVSTNNLFRGTNDISGDLALQRLKRYLPRQREQCRCSYWH